MPEPYKKKFLLIISMTIAFLLSVTVFNYKVDPGHILKNHRKSEKEIASILLGKENVANADKYDERLIQKYIIEKNNKKDVLILGSSRTMLIHNYLFPKKTFFNHSLSCGTLEDYIAIYQMFKEKNTFPKKVIIGVDPWILNINHGDIRWESIEDEYRKACDMLKINKRKYNQNIFYKKYIKLISIPYLHASYTFLRKHEKIKGYYPTKLKKLDVFIKNSDGTASYAENIINPKNIDVRRKAIEFASADPIALLGNFKTLDKSNIEKFEKLVNALEKEKIEVILFLPPYHPIVYKTIQSNHKYTMVKKAEDYFIQFAKEHKIQILGSYNPNKCNLSENDFYDGMHAKTKAINKIILNSPEQQ